MAFGSIRRRAMLAGLVAVPASILGVGALSNPPLTETAPLVPPPQSIPLAGGMRVIAVQTGWVAVKRAHRQFDGPAALRLPAILADPVWTEWMPIMAWVIDHPEGMIAVDTGESSQMADPDYAACDAGTGWFYARNLRVAVRPQDEIGPQLTAFGIAPERVQRVVMTHLHSDHLGGMRWFSGAEFLLSAQDANGHQGALMCRVPPALSLTLITPVAAAMGAFRDSFALTRDGAIAIVPTPGHTPGHQSVLVQAEGRAWLFGGDAAFSLDQVAQDHLAGIVESPQAARQTLQTLRAQLAAMPTIAVFAHDAGAVARLLAG